MKLILIGIIMSEIGILSGWNLALYIIAWVIAVVGALID